MRRCCAGSGAGSLRGNLESSSPRDAERRVARNRVGVCWGTPLRSSPTLRQALETLRAPSGGRQPGWREYSRHSWRSPFGPASLFARAPGTRSRTFGSLPATSNERSNRKGLTRRPFYLMVEDGGSGKGHSGSSVTVTGGGVEALTVKTIAGYHRSSTNYPGTLRTRKRPKPLYLLGIPAFFGLLWITKWWRWRESNPRPKVLHPQLYMLSTTFDLVRRQHDVRSTSTDQRVRLTVDRCAASQRRSRDYDPTSTSTGTSGFGAYALSGESVVVVVGN